MRRSAYYWFRGGAKATLQKHFVTRHNASGPPALLHRRNRPIEFVRKKEIPGQIPTVYSGQQSLRAGGVALKRPGWSKRSPMHPHHRSGELEAWLYGAEAPCDVHECRIELHERPLDCGVPGVALYAASRIGNGLDGFFQGRRRPKVEEGPSVGESRVLHLGFEPNDRALKAPRLVDRALAGRFSALEDEDGPIRPFPRFHEALVRRRSHDHVGKRRRPFGTIGIHLVSHAEARAKPGPLAIVRRQDQTRPVRVLRPAVGLLPCA